MQSYLCCSCVLWPVSEILCAHHRKQVCQYVYILSVHTVAVKLLPLYCLCHCASVLLTVQYFQALPFCFVEQSYSSSLSQCINHQITLEMSCPFSLCSIFSFLAISLVTVNISNCLQGSHMFVHRQWMNFIGEGSVQVRFQAVPSYGVCDNGWLCSETVSCSLTLSNQIFRHPHTHQLLFILGRKEVCGLLVIILQF
jgi:hypothetical protein